MLENIRIEVMQTLEKALDSVVEKYLLPIEKAWQPSDILPDSASENFYEEIIEIQALAKEFDYDFWVVLIGDTITEEALPSYESWLMDLEGVNQQDRNGWTKWIRAWTAEENRHGDLLNKYLYLSGRVEMRELEISTQYLLADGLDIGTGRDPYRNFIYTSFQELATNISHRRVASLAKKCGDKRLAKMCGVIAADEARHAKAYMEFVRQIFEIDPSEMMLALEDMMRKKIVMPAHLLRESGGQIGELFTHFSNAAQRLRVYTHEDYIQILEQLLADWNITYINGLTDKASRARDYLMKLPSRLKRVSERIQVPDRVHEFKWIGV